MDWLRRGQANRHGESRRRRSCPEWRIPRYCGDRELGPVTSYKFGGVTDFGWDRYIVERRNGAETVYLLVDGSGLIISAYRKPVNSW